MSYNNIAIFICILFINICLIIKGIHVAKYSPKSNDRIALITCMIMLLLSSLLFILKIFIVGLGIISGDFFLPFTHIFVYLFSVNTIVLGSFLVYRQKFQDLGIFIILISLLNIYIYDIIRLGSGANNNCIDNSKQLQEHHPSDPRTSTNNIIKNPPFTSCSNWRGFVRRMTDDRTSGKYTCNCDECKKKPVNNRTIHNFTSRNWTS